MSSTGVWEQGEDPTSPRSCAPRRGRPRGVGRPCPQPEPKDCWPSRGARSRARYSRRWVQYRRRRLSLRAPLLYRYKRSPLQCSPRRPRAPPQTRTTPLNQAPLTWPRYPRRHRRCRHLLRQAPSQSPRRASAAPLLSANCSWLKTPVAANLAGAEAPPLAHKHYIKVTKSTTAMLLW